MLRIVLCLALIGLALPSPSHAHGIRLALEPDPGSEAVEGTITYSDGYPGAGEWVEVTDLDDPAAPTLGVHADAQGRFSVPGQLGRRYRVVVVADEDHRQEREIVLGERASR